MSEANSPENPWLVGDVADKVASWIDRLGSIWVEGQITQISKRPGTRTAFITLRDPKVDKSLSVTCLPTLLDSPEGAIEEGSRIIIFAKPTFYTGRGSFSLRALEIRNVGIGQLLADIEILRKQLTAEGLFELARKQKLPFLPKKIGLITGRASAAERDVVAVSQLRWPNVNFRIINTAVQGTQAVPQVVEALHSLDADPEIEVIIIARGGGSVEDLLPFSDELLVREVSAAKTPVVSAIGHEPDHPLLDEVADLRAATPTDAAKRVVPDVIAETELVNELLYRANSALRSWVNNNKEQLDSLMSRPALKRPIESLENYRVEVNPNLEKINTIISKNLAIDIERINTLTEKINTLGPAKTLERGYAIVQLDTKKTAVITDINQLKTDDRIKVKLKGGYFTALVNKVFTNSKQSPEPEQGKSEEQLENG